MNNELWSTIRRLFEVEKLSKRAIAARLHICTRTIRRALGSTQGPPDETRGRPQGVEKLDPYKSYLRSRLVSYPELSGNKLLREITEQGYQGGITRLHRFLKIMRPRTPEKSFLILETLPGEFAQVDWANIGMIQIGNSRHKLSCFVMVLSYSRMIYAELTLSQCVEDFMQAHVNAFDFFCGAPKKINYDNLKTVVLSRVGSDIRFHSHFMNMAGFYLFEPVPCGIRKAHEKGKVERGIQFVRTSWLAGRELVNYTGLQTDLKDWVINQANPRIHGTLHERPIDRFQDEKARLQPLPQNSFDCAIVRFVPSSSQALVYFQSNRYSVPHEFAGKTLTLKASTHLVQIYSGERRLATHARSYEKNKTIENIEHYQGLIAERKKAQADKNVSYFLGLDPQCQAYFKGLVDSELHVQSHLEKIRKLIQAYGTTEVLTALAHALSFNAYGAHYIERIVYQQRAARNMPEPQPLILHHKPQWTQLAVEETDLSVYDDLFKEPYES